MTENHLRRPTDTTGAPAHRDEIRDTRESRLAVVVIGRNEGRRLERSLGSVCRDSLPVLYVDSGSTDRSLDLGRKLASEVLALDDSAPFTAARARNAGLERLLEIDDSLEMIQFVDGDCELETGWLGEARAALDRNPGLGAVCGRLRERHPGASVYARLSQMEWNTPPGETLACGGIAMFRVEALNAVGAFNPAMIAGEEPELCYRLRRAGWKIERLDEPMAVHDGDMTTFRQWWRRAVRSGHAYAENAVLQSGPEARNSIRPIASMLGWGLLAPIGVLGGAVAALSNPWAALIPLAIVCAYALLFGRIRRSSRRLGESERDATLYASFCILGKLPYSLGAARYWISLARGRANALIEYKAPEPQE